jgi:succinyl-diaminopimelate desuccinylase
MTETVELARQLITKPSVTPADEGCQQLIADYLEPLGFQSSHLQYGVVSNLWATTNGTGPLLVFAGHTDVVPAGPEEQWRHPPFDAVVDNGYLYGRGAADMKSSIAAMMIACRRVLTNNQIKGQLGFLITSDEEGPATDGTVKVVEHLNNIGTSIDWCIVGEPTSTTHLGDIVKNGRRGSLNGRVTVKGKQGHVAYPHLAENPVHLFAGALQELTSEQWDNGNEFFPPTTFQISNLHAGTGVENVIPGELSCQFNFRFSTEVTAEQLKQRVQSVLDAHQLNADISWRLSGNPFITGRGRLVEATSAAIEAVCGRTTELSTSGGTSDGRFIAPTGAEVLELGPVNATIHQIDECVSCEDLEQLTDLYEQIIIKLLVE